MGRLRLSVAGGSGYAGGELLRILLGHPKIELVEVSSESRAGEPVWLAHPNLEGRTGLTFCGEIDPFGIDGLMIASRHGESMSRLPAWLKRARKGLKIVDLSADFRLREPALYPRWYGREHAAPALLGSFVYGLTELNFKAIAKASRVANPGCFATALALALGPLARAGAAGIARVTAITGSSGSGAQPGAGTHHPVRAESLRAYKPLRHQHVPELEQLLDRLAGRPSLRVALVPVSGPLVRGIYAVCQLERPSGWSAKTVAGLYRKAYADRPFVRLKPEPPALNASLGSNVCDLHAAVEGDQIVVIAALDNLIKGAAGQAVQNLNVMMGWPESEGLAFAGAYP